MENIALHFLHNKICSKGRASMFEGDIAKLMERHCATCGKLIIVSCPLEYTYKIKTYSKKGNSTDYYCCYSEWNEALKKKTPKPKKNIKEELCGIFS